MSDTTPTLKLRDGLITATIWENTIRSDDGDKTRYSISLVRNFKDGDIWKETSSFNPMELLRAAKLATKAYDALLELKQA